MSITTEHRAQVSVQVGEQEISFETGKLAKQARRRRRRPVRRDDGARHRARPHGDARGGGLLPAHRRRRGADVRRRQDPGRLLQARGAPHRAGDPDGADDRPADPAAVAEGLPQRGAGHLHRAVGRPHDGARHPVHQRRVGGTHDLAAAVPRPGRCGPHRPDRRPPRRQPDAARDGGRGEPRPHRRRHEGWPDDGRGGRRGSARGQDPRGARARAPRDREAVRGAGGPAPPGGQAEVARPRPRRRDRARPRPHGLGAHPPGGPEGVGRHRRRAHGRARAAALDGLDRRGHHASGAGQGSAADAAREAADGRGRAAGAGAVRRRAARPHRRRAGLEAAQVREAPAAVRTDRRRGAAAVPGRPCSGRGRGARGEGHGHALVHQEGVRRDLQGPRPEEDRRREAAARRARHGGDPADRGRGRRHPARARLRPVHARRDAGPQHRHARHGEGRAADRRPVARGGAPLPAPLQLPAVLDRRRPADARPEAARDRPRRARRARARGRSSRRRSDFPYTIRVVSRDARVERLVVDGARSAARRSR